VIEAEHQQQVMVQELQSLQRTVAANQDEIRHLKEKSETAERERLAALEAKARAEDAAARAQVSAREEGARAARSEAAALAARSSLNEAAGDFNRRRQQWEPPAANSSPGWRSYSMPAHRLEAEDVGSPPAGGHTPLGVEQLSVSSPQPDVRSMTIPQMKDWLVRHGKEDVVAELAMNRAKKADYASAMQQHM